MPLFSCRRPPAPPRLRPTGGIPESVKSCASDPRCRGTAGDGILTNGASASAFVAGRRARIFSAMAARFAAASAPSAEASSTNLRAATIVAACRRSLLPVSAASTAVALVSHRPLIAHLPLPRESPAARARQHGQRIDPERLFTTAGIAPRPYRQRKRGTSSVPLFSSPPSAARPSQKQEGRDGDTEATPPTYAPATL